MNASHHLTRVVQAEAERLTQYLYTLPPDAWQQPSACDRWLVRDVVAHLAGAAAAFAERITQGVQGQIMPSAGLPAAGSVNAASWAEPNAQRWLDISRTMGDEVLSTFVATNAQLLDVITGLAAEDWDLPCYHPGGVVPVRTIVGFRLLELVVHGWDIRSALGSSVQLESESLPPLLDFLAAYLDWFFIPGTQLTKPVRYRFILTGVGPNAHDIVIQGNTAHMESPGTVPASVTFRGTAETFVLLLCGRLLLEAVLTDGRFVAEEHQELAVAFGRWFNGA